MFYQFCIGASWLTSNKLWVFIFAVHHCLPTSQSTLLTDISSLKDQLVTSRREGEQSRGRIAELESQLHQQQTVNVTDKEKQVEQLQSRVQDQTQQMTQLQQQFRTKCDECDALCKWHSWRAVITLARHTDTVGTTVCMTCWWWRYCLYDLLVVALLSAWSVGSGLWYLALLCE